MSVIRIPRRLLFRLLHKASVGALYPLSPLFLLPPPWLALWTCFGDPDCSLSTARCKFTRVPPLVHRLVDSAWVYAALLKLVYPIFGSVLTSNEQAICVDPAFS
ncbi:hypothetical protein VTO73DRAFT_4252 [Trametes versicolor]